LSGSVRVVVEGKGRETRPKKDRIKSIQAKLTRIVYYLEEIFTNECKIKVRKKNEDKKEEREREKGKKFII